MAWTLNDSTRRRSGWLLLVAVSFVLSQALALAHGHSDGELANDCAACLLADSPASPVAADPMSVVPVEHEDPQALQSSERQTSTSYDHRSRAPPKHA